MRLTTARGGGGGGGGGHATAYLVDKWSADLEASRTGDCARQTDIKGYINIDGQWISYLVSALYNNIIIDRQTGRQ